MNINKEDALEYILKNIPNFRDEWSRHKLSWEGANGFVFDMSVFGRFIGVTILKKDEHHFSKMSEVIEYLMVNGDEKVQTAVATGAIEAFMNFLDEDREAYSWVLKYLGKETTGYMRAWNNFWGIDWPKN